MITLTLINVDAIVVKGGAVARSESRPDRRVWRQKKNGLDDFLRLHSVRRCTRAQNYRTAFLSESNNCVINNVRDCIYPRCFNHTAYMSWRVETNAIAERVH